MNRLRTLLSRLPKDKLEVLADQAMVSGASFLSAIVLARMLGLNQYGVYTLMVLSIQVIASFHQALIVHPAKSLGGKTRSEDLPQFFSALFLLHLVYAVLSAVLLFLFHQLGASIFPEASLPSRSVTIGLWGFVMLQYLFFRTWLMVLQRYRIIMVIDFIAYPLTLLAFLALHFYGKLTLSNAIAVHVLALGIAGVLPLFLFKWRVIRIPVFTAFLSQIWKFSRWLIGNSMLQWLTGNYFLIMAGALLGNSALGAVRLGQQLMGILNVFFLAMETQVPVVAARIFHHDGLKNLQTYLLSVLTKGGGVVLLVIVAILILATPLTTLVLGNEYDAYVNVVRGFAIINLLIFVGVILRFYLHTIEMTNVIFYAYSISSLVGLFIAKPMVETWQIPGVVGGMFLIHLIMNTSMFVFIKLKLHKG